MEHFHENFRNKLASGSLKLFKGPYLPFGLILSALLFTFADLVVILLKQPAAFWLDSGRAALDLELLQMILSKGLLIYFLLALVYLTLCWLFLTIFTRSVSLIIWLLVTFLHLHDSINWVMGKIPNLEFSDLIASLLTILILGLLLVIFLFRSRINQTLHWKKWVTVSLCSIWILVFFGLAAFRAIAPKPGWQLLSPAHSPGPRSGISISFDTTRGKAVMFGGVSKWLGDSNEYNNDTWEWDGDDWTEIITENQPTLRVSSMLAYDEKNAVTVLFGGGDKNGVSVLNDTWLWDGKEWQEVYPNHSPEPRRGGQLFFDKSLGKIILAGGYENKIEEDGIQSFYDTWIWDGSDWEKQQIDIDYMMITNPVAGYDPIRNRALVYNYYNMLVWSDHEWSVIESDEFPLPRFGPAVAMNPNTGDMVLYGGVEGKNMGDTWIFSSDKWEEIKPDLSPPATDGAAMFYDPARDSFIIYGGFTNSNTDEMWELVLP